MGFFLGKGDHRFKNYINSISNKHKRTKPFIHTYLGVNL